MDKVSQVSEQINMIMKTIPYVQTNFVLGLDTDQGDEPFELTKKFLELSPGVFPAFSLLSAFGQAAPFNLELQRAGRVLPFPFHFLDNNRAMNVKPVYYSWPKFYDHVIDLGKHSFSVKAIARRLITNSGMVPRWLNLVRAVSSEGFGRIKYFTTVRRLLDADLQFRSYFEQETTVLPKFYEDQVREDLGLLWNWLPGGALHHDPNAYLRSVDRQAQLEVPAETKPLQRVHEQTTRLEIGEDALSGH